MAVTAEDGALVQQLVGAGEQGKRGRKLEHWQGMSQIDDAQGVQCCAFGLVNAAAEVEAVAGIGPARLKFVHSWPSVDIPVRVQEQEEQ